MHEPKKYSSWCSYKVSYNLDPSLCINTDNVSILAYMLKRSIVVVEPYSQKNGILNVDFAIHVPLRGNKSRSKQ